MLAISLRLGITRNPEHFLRATPLGFEYLKQGKYISGHERGGFHVAKVNLPLPDPRLRLFIQGKEVSVFKPLDLHGRYPQQGRRWGSP
jgi:hypothetical protein